MPAERAGDGVMGAGAALAPAPDDGGLHELLRLMARLRDPATGCPWDAAQSFETIAPYTIEEAYEVADAIARGTPDALRGELGDLLLQVVFHARMAEEQELFAFGDVVRGLREKLVRRHPHVFGPLRAASSEAVGEVWEAAKARERARDAEGRSPSALDGVALALPALLRAGKLQGRAARVGFDWPDPEGARAKLDEEAAEVREAAASGDPAAVAEEVGDLLFAAVNWARKLGVEPEGALRAANAKFERRFRAVEERLAARGLTVPGAGLALADRVWDEVKRAERGEAGPADAARGDAGPGSPR